MAAATAIGYLFGMSAAASFRRVLWLLSMLVALDGCVQSPCDGRLVDEREQCGDDCGFAVHRLSPCGASGGEASIRYRCIAPTLATEDIRCVVHIPTGDVYRFTSQPAGTFPDSDDWRACDPMDVQEADCPDSR
jgi:hypothetical protein